MDARQKLQLRRFALEIRLATMHAFEVRGFSHVGPSLYAALALKGFFPMDWLATLNQPLASVSGRNGRCSGPVWRSRPSGLSAGAFCTDC